MVPPVIFETVHPIVRASWFYGTAQDEARSVTMQRVTVINRTKRKGQVVIKTGDVGSLEQKDVKRTIRHGVSLVGVMFVSVTDAVSLDRRQTFLLATDSDLYRNGKSPLGSYKEKKVRSAPPVVTKQIVSLGVRCHATDCTDVPTTVDSISVVITTVLVGRATHSASFTKERAAMGGTYPRTKHGKAVAVRAAIFISSL